MKGTVHLERIGANILFAELDNPPRNTLQAGMVSQLDEILREVEANRDVRVLAIAGRGPAFCAGADLRELKAGEMAEARGAERGIETMLRRLEKIRVPTIGLIDGWCIGGGLELALNLDIRIASTAARFVCAGVNVGLIASAHRLPRLIGVAPAKAMLLTGDAFDAETALRFNLVTAVHSPDRLKAAGLALAERIASRAPLSVEATKRIADLALDLGREEGAEAIGREIDVLSRTADHAEAIRAFLSKDEPRFTGR